MHSEKNVFFRYSKPQNDYADLDHQHDLCDDYCNLCKAKLYKLCIFVLLQMQNVTFF